MLSYEYKQRHQMTNQELKSKFTPYKVTCRTAIAKLDRGQKRDGKVGGEQKSIHEVLNFQNMEICRKLRLQKKEKAVGQVVRNLLYNLSSKLLLFLLLLFWSWFRNHHPSFPLFPCMSLRCCNHKTDCNLWKSTTRLVHSMTRKLAFAPHVISLKRGQDE